MAYNGPLEDRVAIRELIETYNDAVHRRDADAWADTWTEDAEWDLLGHVVAGRPAIVETWKGAMDGFSYVGFAATPGAIEIDGLKARARVYVRETLIEHGGARRRIEGAYADELSKADGAWRFARRRYEILHEITDEIRDH